MEKRLVLFLILTFGIVILWLQLSTISKRAGTAPQMPVEQ